MASLIRRYRSRFLARLPRQSGSELDVIYGRGVDGDQIALSASQLAAALDNTAAGDGFMVEKTKVETPVSHADRISEDLTWWADGTIGFFYAGENTIMSLAPNGPNTASVVHNPATGAIQAVTEASIPLTGKITPSDHASGGPMFGPWAYGKPGTSIMVYHGEDHSAEFNWSFLGLAIPTLQGITDLGRIIEPAVPIEGIETHIDMMSGPFVVKDGYVYIYFKDSQTGSAGDVTALSIARTTFDEFAGAANGGGLPVFYKYAGGTWDTPALGGGRAADDLITSIEFLGWCDIAYVETVGAYLLVYSSAAGTTYSVQGRWTHNLLDFSAPFVLIEESTDERWYVTLSPPLDTPGFYVKEFITGDVFDVYTTRSATGGAGRWEDAVLERSRFRVMDYAAKLQELQEQSVRYVNHASDANAKRPDNAAMVIWRGSVEPANKTGDDMWIET